MSAVERGRAGSVKRQLPRWAQLRPLLRPAASPANAQTDRWSGVTSIRELRALARRRVPRSVFDYVDGAAENEVSLARNRGAFARVEFRPRVLRDVSTVDTSTTLLGTHASLPLVFAPTGFTRMIHYQGETAVARAAAHLGIPYALSTMGTTTPERLAAAAPGGAHWFQLYLRRNRRAALDLVQRAAASKFSTLILTVDTATSGARLRDIRNGLTIPPALSARTMLDMAGYPRWWFNLLTSEPLNFACLDDTPDATFAELVDELLDPALTFDDVTTLRQAWPGRLVIKGIQTLDDATAVVDLGADAVVLSNHGGRQLDRTTTPLELLPEAARILGDRAEIYIDGGVLSGADAVAAIALGARGVLVGRAYLYGLMAGGQQGVEHAGAILRNDIIRTMRLLGVTSLKELGPEHVRIRADPH
jgi:L-lactate dehydrogenase (cytochrome)